MHEELAHIYLKIGFYNPRLVLMRSVVTYGYYVRETNQQQVVEVLRRFGLFVSDTISTNAVMVAYCHQYLKKRLSTYSPDTAIVDEFHRCLSVVRFIGRGPTMNECKIHRGCAQFSIASMIVNRAANAFCTAAQTAAQSLGTTIDMPFCNNFGAAQCLGTQFLLLNGLNWLEGSTEPYINESSKSHIVW